MFSVNHVEVPVVVASGYSFRRARVANVDCKTHVHPLRSLTFAGRLLPSFLFGGHWFLRQDAVALVIWVCLRAQRLRCCHVMVLIVVLCRAMTACCRTRRPWRSGSDQPACYISADNVDVLSSCFVSWLLMCRLCGVKGGRDVPARCTFPMEYAHLLRGVRCKSNTGTGVFGPN